MSLRLFRKLTDREYETMLLVIEGKPNKLIADELGISMRTVKYHRNRVMQKLNVFCLSELVLLAVRSGIIE